MKAVINLIHKNFSLCLLCIVSSYHAFSQSSPPSQPKLIVTIVVEQMRYDYLTRFMPHFSKGGLKKMMSQGTLCTNAHINFAFTQSASGYASFATGTTPSQHGIIGNSWYNRLMQQKTHCVQDKSHSCIGCGNTNTVQVSAKQLSASTYAHELYIANKGLSKVFVIGLEPHAATLVAGHKATGVFWLDEFTGNWVTSNYYNSQLPLWLNSFNKKRFAELYVDRTWNTLLPINYYDESLDDKCNFEIGIQNQTEFPYKIMKLRDSQRPYKILKTIPFGNTFTKDLAIELIENEQLGKDNTTDYLHISFTATQEIGNRFGNLSKEVQDAFVRFDYELMFFINYLETYIGKENFLLVLTSNHGVGSSSKYLATHNSPTGIFKSNETMYLLDKYLDTMYGDDVWIEHYFAQQIYLNHNAIYAKNIPMDDIHSTAANFLMQLTGIQTVQTATTLQKSNFCNNNLEHKIANSYHAPRSGDIFIQLKPGWNEQSTDVVASHSSGYTYDTHVPLLWYGWNIQAKTINNYVEITDIAVTLSSITKTPLPNMANGKIIENLIE